MNDKPDDDADYYQVQVGYKPDGTPDMVRCARKPTEREVWELRQLRASIDDVGMVSAVEYDKLREENERLVNQDSEVEQHLRQDIAELQSRLSAAQTELADSRLKWGARLREAEEENERLKAERADRSGKWTKEREYEAQAGGLQKILSTTETEAKMLDLQARLSAAERLAVSERETANKALVRVQDLQARLSEAEEHHSDHHRAGGGIDDRINEKDWQLRRAEAVVEAAKEQDVWGVHYQPLADAIRQYEEGVTPDSK